MPTLTAVVVTAFLLQWELKPSGVSILNSMIPSAAGFLAAAMMLKRNEEKAFRAVVLLQSGQFSDPYILARLTAEVLFLWMAARKLADELDELKKTGRGYLGGKSGAFFIENFCGITWSSGKDKRHLLRPQHAPVGE
eukprot:SAG11_NODE_338_length_10535_cov_8.199885_3_plen_137_part_00